MSGPRRSLVVTRKSDDVQVRVLREFPGMVLWDVHMGAGKLCMDELQLTSDGLFWRLHKRQRIFSCGHTQPSHRYQCVQCKNMPVTCTNGRKRHSWTAPKNGSRRCIECGARAYVNRETGKLLRVEPPA